MFRGTLGKSICESPSRAQLAFFSTPEPSRAPAAALATFLADACGRYTPPIRAALPSIVSALSALPDIPRWYIDAVQQIVGSGATIGLPPFSRPSGAPGAPSELRSTGIQSARIGNHPSAVNNPTPVSAYIQAERALHRIWGPLPEYIIADLAASEPGRSWVTPLGVIEKKRAHPAAHAKSPKLG